MSNLTAQNLSYQIKDTKILDDVSLSVKGGEHVVIIGPNGAGKSTLLGILAGDLAPTSGKVMIGERFITEIDAIELARMRSVLLQSNSVAFSYRVRDVVGLGRTPWKSSDGEIDDEKIVAEAMVKADIMHLGDRDIISLSDGEQARTAFARMLAQQCPVVLLDEPTASLDIGQHEDMLGLVRGLILDGAAVVTVLHNLDAAFSYADKIILLKHGRVFAQGTPEEVMTESILSSAYDHPIEVCKWHDGGVVIRTIVGKRQ